MIRKIYSQVVGQVVFLKGVCLKTMWNLIKIFVSYSTYKTFGLQEERWNRFFSPDNQRDFYIRESGPQLIVLTSNLILSIHEASASWTQQWNKIFLFICWYWAYLYVINTSKWQLSFFQQSQQSIYTGKQSANIQETKKWLWLMQSVSPPLRVLFIPLRTAQLRGSCVKAKQGQSRCSLSLSAQ